jgi:hypothetical protein
MADVIGAAFDQCRPIYRRRDDGCGYGRDSPDGSIGAQSAAGDCPALVVQELVPGHTRRTPLPGMHRFVKQAWT